MKFAYLLPLALLGACAHGGPFSRSKPDEFAVGRTQPLVVPPDYNLVPPKPNEPRPLTNDGQSQAMDALFGPGLKPPPKSISEQNLLDKVGVARLDPNVRVSAADPKSLTVDKGAFLRELMDAPVGTRNARAAEVKIGG